MNPLTGGRFDIHFHRRDAEHAENLFNFLLSAETRLTRLSPPASQALRAGGGKQKSAAFRGFNWLLSIRYPHKWFGLSIEAETFPLPSSLPCSSGRWYWGQRQRKNNVFSAIFASRAKRAVYTNLPTRIA